MCPRWLTADKYPLSMVDRQRPQIHLTWAKSRSAKAQNMEDRVRFALQKLIDIAKNDTGQARRVANFILAWWNADVHGGFDLIDLANVDRDVSEAMATVFTWLARQSDVEYPYAYRSEIEQIIARWRPQAETA